MIDLSGKVTSLWRYPIKGFSPQSAKSAYLTKDSFFPFDRIAAFEVGHSGYDLHDPKFVTKMRYAVLARFASIAKLKTRFDEIENAFYIDDVAYDLGAEAGRHALCRHVENTLSQNEDFDPIAFPLNLLLIDELHIPSFRFTDSHKGFISLLNLNSLRDLEQRLNINIDPLRLRANIWLEDLAAFEDHAWVGKRLKLSDDGPELEVIKPIVRCVATHVNPDTAKLDLDMCAALFDHYGHRDMGIYAKVVKSGTICA